MEFFAKVNDNEIGIYRYEVDESKLYQYKKERIGKDNILKTEAKTIWQLGCCNSDLKEQGVFISQLDFADMKYFYGSHTLKSEEEQNELLEQYFRGELDCYLFDGDSDKVLYPSTLKVLSSFCKPCDYKNDDLYVTVDGVLLLNDEIYLLEKIIRGNLYFSEEEMALVEKQLQCFKFSTEPVDTISLKSLDVLCRDKSNFIYTKSTYVAPYPDIKGDIMKDAERGAKVLEKLKSNF